MNGHPPSGFVSSRLRLWPTNTTGLGYRIVFFKSSSTRNDEEPADLAKVQSGIVRELLELKGMVG